MLALILVLLPAVGLMACAQQEGADEMEMSMAMDPMELRSAIEAISAQWDAAYDAGDAAAVAALYAEDATLMPPDANVVRGRAAIQEFWAAEIAGLPEGTTADLETVEVHGSGDMAYEIGRWTVTSEGAVIAEGKYLVVYKHQADGSWQMIADAWNANEPMEPMEM